MCIAWAWFNLTVVAISTRKQHSCGDSTSARGHGRRTNRFQNGEQNAEILLVTFCDRHNGIRNIALETWHSVFCFCFSKKAKKRASIEALITLIEAYTDVSTSAINKEQVLGLTNFHTSIPENVLFSETRTSHAVKLDRLVEHRPSKGTFLISSLA